MEKEEFIDIKLQKLNINHYGTEHKDKQLSNIEDFVKEFEHHKSFTNYKGQIDYLTADALFNLERFDEALDVFNSLYALEQGLQKTLLAQRVASVLLKLERKKEAILLVEKVLANESDFNSLLDILYWYVLNIDDNEAALFRFKDQVDLIRNGLGVTLPENLNLLDDVIMFLRKERHAASRRFVITLSDPSTAERKVFLKQFIDTETVGYFRKMAQKALTDLEKSESEKL